MGSALEAGAALVFSKNLEYQFSWLPRQHDRCPGAHFFERDRRDDADRAVPAIDFLDGLPSKVAAEIHAILDAVAAAPPPAFSGGGKWEAMHGDMAGFYEVRVQGGGKNHRLFCVLERDAVDLGGSSIVCIDGLSKPRRTAANPRDYRRVKRYGDEFQKRRTVFR